MDINFTEAERLKILYGGCFSNPSKEEEAIEVVDKKQDIEAKKVSRRFLSEIIEARCREIFNLINSNLSNQKYNRIILVGGSSQINNLRFLIEEMFDHPIIQIGVPDEKKGIIETPIYAVSIGTILYALKSNLINPGKNGFLMQIKKTAKVWFQDFFS
jgi:cell division protein FtsA